MKTSFASLSAAIPRRDPCPPGIHGSEEQQTQCMESQTGTQGEPMPAWAAVQHEGHGAGVPRTVLLSQSWPPPRAPATTTSRWTQQGSPAYTSSLCPPLLSNFPPPPGSCASFSGRGGLQPLRERDDWWDRDAPCLLLGTGLLCDLKCIYPVPK